MAKNTAILSPEEVEEQSKMLLDPPVFWSTIYEYSKKEVIIAFKAQGVTDATPENMYDKINYYLANDPDFLVKLAPTIKIDTDNYPINFHEVIEKVNEHANQYRKSN